MIYRVFKMSMCFEWLFVCFECLKRCLMNCECFEVLKVFSGYFGVFGGCFWWLMGYFGSLFGGYHSGFFLVARGIWVVSI